MPASRNTPRAVAISLAWFAFAWAVVRACVQAVTGDEAQNYLFYAGGTHTSHWDASSNNHMLNAIGERLFTSILGLSAFSVRIPNLLAAALYIYIVYRLCEMISTEWKVRIPLLVCLLYNPFIFDFFVAARGYGIANAFLLGAIAVPAVWRLRGGSVRELIFSIALASGLLGLAFTASFSVAFAGATAMLLILVWSIRTAPQARWKLLAAGVIPGLLIVLLVPSWTLLHFHDPIVAGVKSLRETLVSLVNASMYEPDRYLINPLLMPVFQFLRDWILPAAGALALIQFGWILRDRVWKRSRNGDSEKNAPDQNPHTAWLCWLGSLLGGIVVLAIGEHRLAYRIFRLLMPVSRTGLFFLPLVTLLVGIAAAIPPFSRGAAVCRRALIGSLWVLGGYYLSCMRLSYFEEWDYQRDLNPAYRVVACYNHEKNIQSVEVSWYYHAGMNFLRVLSGRETFPAFSSTTPHTIGHEMYVLEGNVERDFIDAQGLKVVFKGAHTGMVVAVRPDLADAPGQPCYVWPEYP